jgi:hypothetical protein
MKKPFIAIITAVFLLGALCVDAQAMFRLNPTDVQTAAIGVPGQNRALEASAPAKVWESLSLHQTVGKNSTPAAVVSTYRAANPATSTSSDRSAPAKADSPDAPQPASPRAPPQQSIAL